MQDKNPKYRKEYYLENKAKLVEYGGKYYSERIHPKVELLIKHWEFILYID